MVWHKLISTERMKWDPNTRTFGASEQEWDEYLEEKPEAAPFRLKELLFAEKLDIVFDGTVNLGQTNRPYNTPRKNTNWMTAEDPTSRRRKQDNKANENENQERFKKHQHGLTNTVFPVEELIGARLDGGNFERCCYDAGESRSVITVQSPPSKLSYSIEECIKCLDLIEELEQGSEVYLFALDIFLKKEYREIFLNLKKSSTKIAWLERLRSVGPPLPLH
ncbi:hypothetical protein ACJIZ3_006064 [Penstemon smallii]|uniref:Myb/SANT-like domain-containing protein n=1 Tax=Penstemon smallii TaxID=265156 RepID=A0ABD3S6L4_9LAMI